MRTARIFYQAMLGIVGLLLVTGCASSLSNRPGAADDPPLPQPAGGAPPPPPVTPPVAPSPQAAPVRATATPLQSSSGVPVATAPKDSGVSDAPTAFDNVEWVNPSLVGKVAILRAGSNRTDANLLSVFVGLKNKTAHELQVEIQTIYKDKSGQALTEGTGNWIPMKLKPHGEAQYRSVSISEDATDFLVRIRKAGDVPTVGNP